MAWRSSTPETWRPPSASSSPCARASPASRRRSAGSPGLRRRPETRPPRPRSRPCWPTAGPTAATSCGRGSRQLEGGQADRAAGNLRAAVAREPDLYLGWLWLGDAEAARGRDQRGPRGLAPGAGAPRGRRRALALGRGQPACGTAAGGPRPPRGGPGHAGGPIARGGDPAARPGPAGQPSAIVPSPRRSSPASACATAPAISSSASRRSRWRTRASRSSGGGGPPGSSSPCAPTPASRSSPSTAGSRA